MSGHSGGFLKNRTSLISLTFCVIAGTLGFMSCASHPIKSSPPSTSVLHSEQESNPSPTYHKATGTADQASSAAATLPQYAAKVVAATTAFSAFGENVMALLLLLMALLLLWAALRQLRRREKSNIPTPLIIPRKAITPPAPSLRNGVLITRAGPAHLLQAKHNYHPIVPVNHKDDIWITAFYYDQIKKMHFAPTTTIKKVAGWAAYQCEISEESLQEVYLTIRNHFEPLRDTAHVARFVPRHRKHLELDVKVLGRIRV
jgi:hypothetical protein